ncbi:uncharacterized protein Dwil_GK16294 [Drosophila willistoni]|uniref:TATA box-binding protein-like 1 n=1 Tax=Drosophila willistoni TaxID=7260 RepID=B4N1H5_DROWI|nr:uncharacterized protein Dwil_GK16294 [Drosophila willistoni]
MNKFLVDDNKQEDSVETPLEENNNDTTATSKSQSQSYPLTGGLMQNDMVSIPAANLNGGLKAASSNAGAGTGGVSSSVLANAPRVYLTSASTFMANRQSMAVTGGTASVVGKVPLPNMVGNFSTTTASAAAAAAASGTAVRYFSQFSKPSPVSTMNGGTTVPMPIAMPVKLLNGVLANGNKPMIFSNAEKQAAAVTGTGTTTILNGGNRFMVTKMEHPDTTATAINSSVNGDGVEEGTVIKEEEPLSADKQQQNNPLELTTGAKAIEETEVEPELDIVINNVVCSFSVRCHLKLREIALHGANVEYRRENGMVTMKLRHPYTTASIWSSGRITCTGATSEIMAKVAARRYARCLGKLGFPTRFQNFRIVNVLGTCSMPWAIKIVNFSERHRDNASYEPELHPGVTYKMREPKATLKIFSTGSITVTAASVNDVEAAIQHIYPLAYEFRKQRSPEEMQHMRAKQKQYNNNSADPSEVEEMLATQAKVDGKNDIFVNTTAAHTNATTGANAASGDGSFLNTTSIHNMQRLKQFESYRQMMNQTQDERRHVPFTGTNNASSTASATATASSTSTGESICANARRRATECWATKLQNKRPRYNDPGSQDTANAGNMARKFGNSSPGTGGTGGGGVVGGGGGVKPQQQALKAPLTGTITKLPSTTIAASAMGTLRSINSGTIISTSNNSKSSLAAASCSTIPVDVLLKQQNSSRQQQQQPQQQQHLETEHSFSPSDFHVDDLIEEDDDMEMMHY